MPDWGSSGIGTFVSTTHSEPYPEIDPAKVKFPSPHVVCVIGASRGIGAGCAFAYAKAGVTGLVLSSRNVPGLQDTASRCKHFSPGTQIETIACDISSSSDIAALATKIKESFGRLDVVVINSGYSGPVVTQVEHDDPDTVQQVTSINYIGTYFAAHYLIPLLLATPASRNSIKAFLAVGSTASFIVRGPIANAQYCISKLAQLKLIEHIHEQYKDRGLLSVAVHPGAVLTQMADDTTPAEFREYLTDDPDLCGAFMVWLTKPREQCSLYWLGGRHLEANWDVAELMARKDDIVERDLLKSRLMV